ncbi:hypothetical protein [Cohaesibacter celericrescens]|uniref:hypothetical protein n=1 Tax=Cohaesibacter celericrescens TaxID=2067669 RepID=UPI0015E0B323|nr:hypothetical protein [Cohaesibacter celericrescens]
MANETGDQGLIASNRKVADYLLSALKQSQADNATTVRQLVYLAEAELEKSSGNKPATG